MTNNQVSSALFLRSAGATLISISECLGVSYHELKVIFKKYPTIQHLEKSEIIANESSDDYELLDFNFDNFSNG